MKMKRISSFILLGLYVAACLFSLQYEHTAKNVLGFFINEQEDANILDARFSKICDWHKEGFPYRQRFLDVYGLTMKLFDRKIIGDFAFLKDESNSNLAMVDSNTEYNEKAFARSLMAIEQGLTQNQALLFVSYPRRASFFDYSHSPEIRIVGDASRVALDELQSTTIECLDMDNYLYEEPYCCNRSNARFKTDLHYTTETELWIANTIADWLRSKGFLLYNYDNVFDFTNYDVSSYDFLGNCGRNVGRYFVGTDIFNIYKPRFDTDITVTVPDAGYNVRGTFEQAVLNGYENTTYDTFTYWVTDYGHFGSPCYYYYNNLALDSAPNVLFICDSAAMRTFSYLLLSCKSVTVLDPRYFGDMPYVNCEMASNSYDAVVVLGSDSLMFKSLVVKPTQKMIREEDYGGWIGNSGVCLDRINDVNFYDCEGIVTNPNDENYSIVGWAADFSSNAPFANLFCVVAGKYFKCDYGLDRQSVVDNYGIESLRYTGFQVMIPNECIHAGDQVIEFIGETDDVIFEPVAFKLNVSQ